MRVFKEYLLDKKSIAEQSLYMPHGAEVVKVLDTGRGLTLLALVTLKDQTISIPELRIFKICAIEERFYAGTVKYIGSFDSGTKHVIEIIKEF